MSDTDRIERLESIVRGLFHELEELRGEVARLRGTADHAPHRPPDGAIRPDVLPPVSTPAADVHTAPPPPSPKPVPSSLRGDRALDLEALVGRYATIALATVVILVGAGSFLTWAIAHGLLGPAARVILGALAAAAVAALGAWLRTRGATRFSSTVLALSLAILHVDAWAAGPRLHVVAPWIALIAAGVASAALAVLAHRAQDEALFCVGLGGALLAPFVVSQGGGNAVYLAVYGWIVISAGLLALRTRGWQLALVLLALGCAVYAGVTVSLTGSPPAWALRHVPVIFALACAAVALLGGARGAAGPLALAFLAVAAVTVVALDNDSGRAWSASAVGVAGTLMAFDAVRRPSTSVGARIAGVGGLPLLLLYAAIAANQAPIPASAAWIPGAWTVLAVALASAHAPDRNGYLTIAAVAAGTAVVLALRSSPEWCIVTLAVLGALLSVLMRWRRSALLAIPALLDLAATAVWVWVRLAERAPFSYRPLLTRPSVAALVVVVAWIVFTRQTHRADDATRHSVESDFGGLLPWMPALAAFVFVRQELSEAISRDVAAFLLIVYYAAVGVVTIAAGRRQSKAAPRAIGLALALYAGVKALVQAWSLSAIGLRVGTCVLVGLFIAVVAYWYRAPDTHAA